MTARRLLPPDEAATYLGTTVEHLMKLRERRIIPATKLGKYVRFDVRQLDRWIELHTEPAR